MALDYEFVKSGWIELIFKIDKKIREQVDEFIISEVKKYGEDVPILPPKHMRLASLTHFQPEETKVVLIGQDPYQNPGLAMGLSFSVPADVMRLPPSLINIYKELENDIPGFTIPTHGDLTKWAQQGVLLLNTSLTVLQHNSNSHKKVWVAFIHKFLELFSDAYPNTVYILMGNDAKALKSTIKKGIFIECGHPSPLSANRGGFFNTKPFSRTNEALIGLGREPIDWSLY